MKQTSRTANERYKTKKVTDKRIILWALRKYGVELTGLDISERCVLTYHQVMRRMSELENENKVKTTTKNVSQNRMMYKII